MTSPFAPVILESFPIPADADPLSSPSRFTPNKISEDQSHFLPSFGSSVSTVQTSPSKLPVASITSSSTNTSSVISASSTSLSQISPNPPSLQPYPETESSFGIQQAQQLSTLSFPSSFDDSSFFPIPSLSILSSPLIQTPFQSSSLQSFDIPQPTFHNLQHEAIPSIISDISYTTHHFPYDVSYSSTSDSGGISAESSLTQVSQFSLLNSSIFGEPMFVDIDDQTVGTNQDRPKIIKALPTAQLDGKTKDSVKRKKSKKTGGEEKEYPLPFLPDQHANTFPYINDQGTFGSWNEDVWKEDLKMDVDKGSPLEQLIKEAKETDKPSPNKLPRKEKEKGENEGEDDTASDNSFVSIRWNEDEEKEQHDEDGTNAKPGQTRREKERERQRLRRKRRREKIASFKKKTEQQLRTEEMDTTIIKGLHNSTNHTGVNVELLQEALSSSLAPGFYPASSKGHQTEEKSHIAAKEDFPKLPNSGKQQIVPHPLNPQRIEWDVKDYSRAGNPILHGGPSNKQSSARSGEIKNGIPHSRPINAPSPIYPTPQPQSHSPNQPPPPSKRSHRPSAAGSIHSTRPIFTADSEPQPVPTHLHQASTNTLSLHTLQAGIPAPTRSLFPAPSGHSPGVHNLSSAGQAIQGGLPPHITFTPTTQHMLISSSPTVDDPLSSQHSTNTSSHSTPTHNRSYPHSSTMPATSTSTLSITAPPFTVLTKR
ncbi:hypothetical protein BLNAU_5875 [Blattamonas nauphoetae]|uniref:BZIP domain-containing protein n=1 Tax=Blattamonas nauphoetae TaxID=2049346 RepID=A0ABQ9Y5Q9_9EUKA|nr:hypothetical protein BLNAU_5875 [Blattamonas nauphoetae]